MPNLEHEDEILSSLPEGSLVAGCDEAGRGSWAGPLVAAAVILAPGTVLPGITDSKQVKKSKHLEYSQLIMANAVAIGMGIVEPEYIDRFGVGEANKKALELAIADLPLTPQHVLIDGGNQQIIHSKIPQTQIEKGDATSLSIAAASILAKTTHDLLMKEYHEMYPEYGWATNTGYGTQAHANAIAEFGITEHHRKSFKPIRDHLKRREG